MIDLTPLDVRKKAGDFAKSLRGYDPAEVDAFLELVAERLEELVKETIALRERSERLQEQVSSQEGRERAVQQALVTAQELRDDMRGQAEREAGQLRREAELEAADVLRRAEAEARARTAALQELERKRIRFLRSFRALLERELDVVEVEEGREPLEDVEVELDLGGGRAGSGGAAGKGEATAADRPVLAEDLGGPGEPDADGEAPLEEPDAPEFLVDAEEAGEADEADAAVEAALSEAPEPIFEPDDETRPVDPDVVVVPLDEGESDGAPAGRRKAAGDEGDENFWIPSIPREEEGRAGGAGGSGGG